MRGNGCINDYLLSASCRCFYEGLLLCCYERNNSTICFGRFPIESVDADLRAAFERYHSRIAQLQRNNLAKLFEASEISPDSIDPEDIESVI